MTALPPLALVGGLPSQLHDVPLLLPAIADIAGTATAEPDGAIARSSVSGRLLLAYGGVWNEAVTSLSSTSSFVAIADGAVGGNRCVAHHADGTVGYAGNTTLADQNTAVGISTGAAADGAPVTVQFQGLMTEPSWAWTPLGLIYLGLTGLLTQTAPTAPSFCRVLGHAIDATSMWIGPQPPIVQT